MGTGTIVHVWHASPGLASSTGSRGDCLGVLDASERTRFDAFRFDADAATFLAAHALLRSALSALAPVPPKGWRFRRGSHGKPYVDEPARHRHLSFSLSHAAGRVAVAVASGCEVGIDVERVDPAVGGLENPEWYLAPAEIRGLGLLPPARRLDRFFALWTLKEAFLKASGLGLSVRPPDLSFDLDGASSPALSFSPGIGADPRAWQFFVLAAPERHAMALAVGRATGVAVELRIHEARRVPLSPGGEDPGTLSAHR